MSDADPPSDPATSAAREASSDADELLDEVGEQLEDRQLPISIFHDAAIYRLELERVFAESWVFVGHASEIPEPGDYRQRYIGEDPFVFVRDEDGEIRVIFNSCRHRGSKVCRSEKGNTTHFRCPYHGWTYRTTGELVGVPQRDAGWKHLDLDEKRLHEAPQVDDYHGLVFACLDPDAEPLESYLGGATWYLDLWFDFIEMEVIGDPHRWTVDADWKTPAENFAGDNYHVPSGHRSAIDVGIGSDTATGEEESELLAIAEVDGHSFGIYQIKGDDPAFYWGHPPEVVETFRPERLTDEQLDVAERSGVSLGNLFPNLSFIHLGGTNDPAKESVGTMCLRQWQPKGPGELEVWNWILAPADAPEAYKERVYESGMGTFSLSGNFEADDIAIWGGIAESAGGVFARQTGATTDFTMGEFDGAPVERDESFPGPGEVYLNGGLTDENQLTFYRAWHRAMTGGEG